MNLLKTKERKRYMRLGINKAAFILISVFLTSCGRKEISTEVENEENALNEAAAQYPMIATPSAVK